LQENPENPNKARSLTLGFAQQITQQYLQAWKANRSWVLKDVLAPFLATRLGLLLVGWFSQYLALDLSFPYWDIQTKPWLVTTHRLLDIWARWDTSWYLQIINSGYHAANSQAGGQSSLAFFPLFPYLVKLFAYLIPAPFRSQSGILVVGLLLTNLFLLGSLVILYQLVRTILGEDAPARRTIWYVLIFPTSFFLSSFLSESTFLFFSLAAFYLAEKQHWTSCGLMGFFAALSRPVGVLMVVPLAWVYLRSIHFQWRLVRWTAGWLLLIPLGVCLYLAAVYPITGDFWAPINFQAAWSRTLSSPWQTLLQPTGLGPTLRLLQQLTALGTFGLLIYTFWKIPNLAYGLYVGLLILLPLLSGTLISFSRFVLVAFPLFISLGLLGKRPNVDRLLTIIFLMLQALLMAGWSQFYPIY
jgi:hypothetical protein